MTTGIFGGTFNPIHNGHVALAHTLLSEAQLDELWFVVSPQNPWKQHQTLLDDALRLQMVEAALEGEACMKASDWEFRLPRPSYMWHTLQSLSAAHPEREFVLIIGGDNWQSFSQWYRSEDILKNYRIVVYPRAAADGQSSSVSEMSASAPQVCDAPPSARGITLLGAPLLNVSSTEIRQRISAGKPFGHLVPPRVAEIIRHNNLYSQP